MSLPLVSLVGHSRLKFCRLAELYLKAKPSIPHRLVLTFNGEDGSFLTEIELLLDSNPGVLRVRVLPNDLDTRDVGMHVNAMRRYPKAPWVFCLNDDVETLKPGWFEEAAEAIDFGMDVVGVQPNFIAIFGPEHIAKVRGKTIENVLQFIKEHGIYRFIRTHAFAATRKAFFEIWAHSEEKTDPLNKVPLGGSRAMRFERWTMKVGKWALFMDPETAADSDYFYFRDGSSMGKLHHSRMGA